MQKRLGGVWELFIPNLQKGELYKYEIRTQKGHCYQKADPYGFQHEVRPAQSSIVSTLDNFKWNDETWMSKRDKEDQLNKPISVYEMHLGSWMHASNSEPFIEKDGTKKADAFLAMFHDQGLPVIKTSGFGNSVNITLGLPFIRTSVDHGTAYDMAGKKEVDETSLIEASYLAFKLAKKNQCD